MLKIEEAAGQVIAGDTQASIAAINAAVISFSRLCGSIVEVGTASDLPVSATQKALSATAKSLLAAVEGRDSIAAATRELIKVQSVSTLRATGFGCPDGIIPRPAAITAPIAELYEG